jgi:hypothetical protein
MKIKGMSLDQLKDVVDALSIEFFRVKCNIDTATNCVDTIKLLSFDYDIEFSVRSFDDYDDEVKLIVYDNLYDWVMAYLKGEWNDEFLIEEYLKYNK